MDGARSSVEGWGSGLIGVVIFSGSLPATRVAVADFSPLFLTGARAAIAALLGGALLVLLRQPRPLRRDIPSLAIVSLGVVIGFPLLTALALQHITSARSIVFIGLLPLATAIFGVLRGGERPRLPFWLFSGLGSATVAAFALSGGGSASPAGDLLMIAAIVLCGLAYAEGAKLSRRLGGWQVISWALVLSAPPMLALTFATLPASWEGIGVPAWRFHKAGGNDHLRAFLDRHVEYLNIVLRHEQKIARCRVWRRRQENADKFVVLDTFENFTLRLRRDEDETVKSLARILDQADLAEGGIGL